MTTIDRSAVLGAAEVFSVRDRVALVTGASSGLGARFAEVLAAGGAHVVLGARRADKLTEVAARCPGSVAVPCDVQSDDGRRELVDAAVTTFGRLDVLVNNAGGSTVVPALEESVAGFAATVALNLTATFALCQAAGAVMANAGGGAIINVASIYGLVASGRLPQAGYTASKGGVVNLTRELAAQWADAGIRVNALCPGWFPSELTASMLDGPGREWINRRTPLARPGDPHELDGALLLLASDASSYMTGAVVTVDGGYTIV